MGKGTGTVEVQWYRGRPPAAVREQRTARWHQRSWNASTERRGSRPRYQALYMPPARRSPPPTRSQSRLQAARIWANIRAATPRAVCWAVGWACPAR